MKKMKNRIASHPSDIYSKLSSQAAQAYDFQRVSQSGVGDTIRSFRQTKGIRAAHLARKAGLDPRTLAAIESGHIQNPSLEKLRNISASLEVSIADLFLHMQASQPENFYLGEQRGTHAFEFQQEGFKAVSYTPMNPSFFIGKVTLAGKAFLNAGVLPSEGHFFIQMILGKLKLSIQQEEVVVKEGSHLLMNGRLPHTFQNLLIKETSFLFVSVPSFVAFSSRR